MSYIQRKAIYQGHIVDVGLETFQPEGHEPFEFEIVRHPGGAAVVALNEQNQVCLLRQYRPAVNGWIWEIPAGKIDFEEPPRQTAERELQEEVGLQANDWDDLGDMFSSPGFCNEIVSLYLARTLTQGAHNREPHELMEVHWVDFSTALEWAQSNKIRDAKTVIALYRSQALL
ncbi:NUDIX hydrolase [Candidatus Venteria ishoeyi]|uniref:GDP-mannose pyrophosphatase n=1 Tax=Candidatus Venteria ishoeyi TaxID=1899563 RepID=A0A1H6FBY9_9GAMM|nr:NUDIX hydrolase [Candidatus Venteria ishoeyi]MDM8547179.1 NUDIX hydrolase [Candidatus Venteria ishoeyi]SEH06554.1 ADP-ribose pyrophosphatase [Candidatus Venteria ishoeyi]